MFKIPRVNVIESDEGFSVEVLGRTGLLYIEGEKSIKIDSEVLRSSEIAVVKESIQKWNPPYDAEIIDDDKREAIIENIRNAFNFSGAYISIW
jgi:hypothetical protein